MCEIGELIYFISQIIEIEKIKIKYLKNLIT